MASGTLPAAGTRGGREPGLARGFRVRERGSTVRREVLGGAARLGAGPPLVALAGIFAAAALTAANVREMC